MIKLWHPLDVPRRTKPATEPTEAQQKRRRNFAKLLCLHAKNQASWRIADRMAQAWECGGCAALGVLAAKDWDSLKGT